MTVIAANARRYPVSAQCRILGVPRSTYYHMLAHPPRPKAPDPIEPDVVGAFEASRGGYGARRLKIVLARSGVVASRRRMMWQHLFGRSGQRLRPASLNPTGVM